MNGKTFVSVLLCLLVACSLLLSGCNTVEEPEASATPGVSTQESSSEETVSSVPEASSESEPSADLPVSEPISSSTAPSEQAEQPAPEEPSPEEASDPNRKAYDPFDCSVTKNKLAVWYFTLPSENENTGDCMLVRSPNGKTMLIDNGSGQGGALVSLYLERLGIQKLDAVVVTHMHRDHVGGALSVFQNREIVRVYGTPLKDYQSMPARNFLTELRKRHLKYNVLTAGMKVPFDVGVEVEVLYPNGDFTVPETMVPEEDGTFTNNSSVVLRISYGKRSFLFTGDIESDAEAELVAKVPEKLKCDVLKVPHHGSITSSTEGFVKAVNPAYSVITCYAFNDFTVLDRYLQNNTKTFVTSIDGTVLFLTDGKDLTYSTKK